MAEIREIKVAFNDYRADLTLDVGFEGNIPMDVPLLALPEVVNITISNSLSDGTAIAYYRNADNNDATQVLYANTTLSVLKNTKVSIGRANPTLYNITNIKVTSQDGTLLKDTSANLFDLENVQQPQTIQITSQKLLTTENLARFITVLDSAYKFNTEIENEFTIGYELDHPNIINYFNLYKNDSGVYIIKEYVDGVDILAHLSKIRSTKLFIKELKKYIFQL
jgi:serine/threonine protein kinase